jgi:hypothetical protein
MEWRILDLSEAALEAAKARLWSLAAVWEPQNAYDIWHDRAAFHFLIEDRDRAAYVSRLERALKMGG